MLLDRLVHSLDGKFGGDDIFLDIFNLRLGITDIALNLIFLLGDNTIVLDRFRLNPAQMFSLRLFDFGNPLKQFRNLTLAVIKFGDLSFKVFDFLHDRCLFRLQSRCIRIDFSGIETVNLVVNDLTVLSVLGIDLALRCILHSDDLFLVVGLKHLLKFFELRLLCDLRISDGRCHSEQSATDCAPGLLFGHVLKEYVRV